MTNDHWNAVAPIGSTNALFTWQGETLYIAREVDDARAKDAVEIARLTERVQLYAQEVLALYAEIARLTAQVQADAHLRSVVELYRADPLAMAEALVRMRDELGAAKAQGPA